MQNVRFSYWAIGDEVSVYVIDKSLMLNQPNISCREHMHTVSETSLMVYLDLFLSTVLTKTLFNIAVLPLVPFK